MHRRPFKQLDEMLDELSERFEEDEVSASCKNGVLSVTLPEASEEEPEKRRIEIE